MRSALWAVALFVASSSFAAAWDIAPPPRGEWVRDETAKLSTSTVQTVNGIAAALDSSGAGQLGVLVIASTKGHNPRDFATGVFNNWGVGHASSNDGILLMIAVDDRKAEIILGDGSRVKSFQTDVVMRDDVVAHMKQKDLSGAVLSAAQSLDTLMRRATGTSSAPHPGDNTGLGPNSFTTPGYDTPQVDDVLDAYARGDTHFPERSPRSWVVDLSEVLTASQRAQLDVAASDIYATSRGRTFFLVFRGTQPEPDIDELTRRFVAQVARLSSQSFAVVAYDARGHLGRIWLPENLLPGEWERSQQVAAQYELQRAAEVDLVTGLIGAQRFAEKAITSGIPPRPMGEVLSEGVDRHSGKLALAGGGVFFALLAFLRRWNRNRIRDCKSCNVAMQRLSEEREDTYLDDRQQAEERLESVDYDVWHCGRCQSVQVLDYSKWFSGYARCKACHAKTMRSTSTTISHATEYSTGLVQIDEACQHCNYRNSYTRTTARISRSSSSSSYSSSSSSSSFGGGSSSGGGSSGSW
ncbi:MAG: TPM domain-containing protein [Archangium sp.]